MNKEKQREYIRRHYWKHRDKILEQQRRFYDEHREEMVERGRKNREASKNKCPTCGVRISPYAKCCPKHKQYSKGENSPHWKGGRITSRDYVLLHKPSHPRANSQGYILEHIWVWEQTHSQELPKGWVIHHLNGIKTDNRPTNLIALPNRRHSNILKAKAKRIQELEAIINHQRHLL